MRLPLLTALLLATAPVLAAAAPCQSGSVFEDADGDGLRGPGERGLAGVRVSDGEHIAVTDARGDYRLASADAGMVFVIKPAGYRAAARADGLPDIWRQAGHGDTEAGSDRCRPFALVPQAGAPATLQALVMADSQTSSVQDVDYYRRDIVQPLVGRHRAQLGMTLGDITNDDPALYPLLTAATTELGVPWLHVPGNHDMDLDATGDADSLRSYHRHLGPDTYAWEEPQMVFIGLDDIVATPGARPAYIGGFREDQFGFLERYLGALDTDRLVVIGIHMPLFDPRFRAADRQRLFDLLARFPRRLVLSAHTHTQQHVFHDAAAGWKGQGSLHEYNVGAACGAFWSGVKDEQGIPDATMSDGTPNGYGLLNVAADGSYSVEYRAARAPEDEQIALHAPRVLRKGAYPAWGVYANVYMGHAGTRVEYRIDGGDWQPMKKVDQPDPRLLVENVADDLAGSLRGYDRSPEATPSTHLWRGALPTALDEGEHDVEVRAVLDGREYGARTRYRLQSAQP